MNWQAADTPFSSRTKSSSRVVTGASWAGRDGRWHEGSDRPTCIGTDAAAKTHVRLGIVDVEADREGAGGARVVWLRCLDQCRVPP